MKEILISKLHQYLQDNNPELLWQLEEDGTVTKWLTEKVNSIENLIAGSDQQPEYIIEEVCINELTKELRPSKFNYIGNILQEEFENDYQQFFDAGILRFEVINLITECQPLFKEMSFIEENENSTELKNAVTGTISEYLEKREA